MEKMRREEFKLSALLQGVDIDKGGGTRKQVVEEDSDLLFKDPSEWEGLSKEEKESLTKRMKKRLSPLKDSKMMGNMENASRS